MLLATAEKGMLDTREALRKEEGVSNPTFISEQIQKLAQYTGATEEILAEDEAQLVKDEAEKFKSYLTNGKSPNMAKELLKHDLTDDRAEIVRLTRLCGSSWRIIGVAQSRIKHMIAEATNQI